MMKMNFLKTVAAAALVAGASVAATSASAATACADGSPDATDRVSYDIGSDTFYFACEFGTGFANYSEGDYNNVFFGGGYTEIERDSAGTNTTGDLTGGGGTKSGSFSISDTLLNTYSSFVLVFKSGQESVTAPSDVVAYNLGTRLDGDYLTPFAKTNGTGCAFVPPVDSDSEVAPTYTYTNCEKDISHIALLGKVAAVPLPASGLLLLSVLGAGAFVGRRKKAA